LSAFERFVPAIERVVDGSRFSAPWAAIRAALDASWVGLERGEPFKFEVALATALRPGDGVGAPRGVVLSMAAGTLTDFAAAAAAPDEIFKSAAAELGANNINVLDVLLDSLPEQLTAQVDALVATEFEREDRDLELLRKNSVQSAVPSLRSLSRTENLLGDLWFSADW
jgi:hypothetical protein